jgi:hypothetical protein
MCEIWDSDGGEDVCVDLLGSKVVSSYRKIPTYGRTTLWNSSVFSPKDEDSIFLRNVDTNPQVFTALSTTKPTSTAVEISTKKQKISPTTRHEDAWRERRYRSYSFLTTTLYGVEWSASRPSRALAPGKGPSGTHWTGGWVGLRAGLDTEVRGKILSPLPGIETRSYCRPACSQTLYWLSYPAHRKVC